MDLPPFFFFFFLPLLQELTLLFSLFLVSFSKVRSCCSPDSREIVVIKNKQTNTKSQFWIWDRNSFLGYMPHSSPYSSKIIPLLNLMNGDHIIIPSARDASKMSNTLSASWHCNVFSRESAKLCSQYNLHIKKKVVVIALVCANMYLRAQISSCIPIQHFSKAVYLVGCLAVYVDTWEFSVDIWCHKFYTYQVKKHCMKWINEYVIMVFFRGKYFARC